MDQFEMLFGLAIVALVGMLLWKKMQGKSAERYKVTYSEIVGDKEIEHTKDYIGGVNLSGLGITFKVNAGFLGIGGKDIMLPYPMPEHKIHTFDGATRLRVVRIDKERYAYKVPVKDNEVFVYKRDDKGNVIKRNGKFKIIKQKWSLCDDYIEPEMQSWYDHKIKDLEERHKQKNKWDDWKAPITLAIIFLFAIIAMKFQHDANQKSLEAITGNIEETNKNADEMLDIVNRYVNRNPGDRDIPNEDVTKDSGGG